MTSLLIGVFGFFGLHGLLWMQRALVGKLRGEFKIGHGGEGPYVRRFSSMQMGVHIAIVSSFLLLAATGLPLKFAEATWAPTLMSLLGGAEVAGWLHRLAGVVTFGYFIWHLGMLVHGLFVKNERGFFWGPRSMVPQPRDLFDFIGDDEVLPVPGAAAEVRPLHLLGEVRLPGGVLGCSDHRRVGA